MNKINNLSGVIPALVTPFNKDEEVDEAKLRRIIDELISENVSALYLTGSTGECFTMDASERNRVLEVTVDQVNGRVPVIAHIGDIGTKKSIALAKAAAEIGVDALSSVPPFYWKFSEDEIFEYYERVSSSTDLPFIVYNIALAGLMGRSFIERLAKLNNVVGVKYTATTHFEIPLLKNNLGKDFKVYSGCDEMGLSGLVFGADGLIGSFYNLMPELYKRIYDNYISGNLTEAARLQHQADLIIATALKYSYVSVIKMAMGWKGTDAGICRRPFKNYYEIEEKFKNEFRLLRDDNEIKGVKFLDAI